MSWVIVSEDGNMMSFSDFISLGESVSPKDTEYGSEFKNKAWKLTKDKSHLYTFFSHKPDHHVAVNLNRHTGVLGFGTHIGDPSADIKHYDEKRKGHGEALKVFGKVAHVAIQGAKHHDLKHVKFNGADPQLTTTYHKIANNKIFQKHMANHGFHYKGTDSDNNHTFEKSDP